MYKCIVDDNQTNIEHAHPHRLEVLLLHLHGLAAELEVDPAADVVHALGGGDDVEGRGHGAPLLKVGDPQLAAGKFPLGIRLFLQRERESIVGV